MPSSPPPRPAVPGRFPDNTRLSLERVLTALAEDGYISHEDIGRARQAVREQRTGVDIHPLVLIANLKFRNRRRPDAELNLETLTHWLAQQAGVRYLRIDPT
ncbi:MAG: type II/IV secretion system protein, partial [Gammaproteobacteria bacterium]|nr:type II/IV secretion system protein [Gammaproteobacteria bacterium]